VTEAEWLAATNPEPMLALLRDKMSERKARLFGCACCRSIWSSLTDDRSRQAVEVAERFTDGLATDEELDVAHWAAFAVSRNAPSSFFEPDPSPFLRVQAACQLTGHLGAARPEGEDIFTGMSSIVFLTAFKNPDAFAHRAALLRCIAGSPFRLEPDDNPDWLTWNVGTVRDLATEIYEGRAFDRLPLLADALEDAGCADAAMLGHLRVPGPHCRGCWVVDRLSGRE
jgi:hypothetical protein